MFKPVKMSKVNILLLDKYVTAVTRELGEHGVLHLVDATKQSELLKSVEQQSQNRVQGVLARCEQLMKRLGISPDCQAADTMSQDDISTLLNTISSRYMNQEEAITELLLQKSGVAAREREDYALFPWKDVKLDTLSDMAHFSILTGRLPQEKIAQATAELAGKAIVLPIGATAGEALVLTPEASSGVVRKTLAKFGFAEISKDGDELIAQLAQCRENIRALNEEYSERLASLHRLLKSQEAVQSIQGHFGQISNLYCISGWVPNEHLDELREFIDKATHGTGILEITKAEDDALVQAGVEQVPVSFHTNAFLRPFQMLITNFGLPGYNEIDPSFFVAVSFMIIFGFMFGDVGQGAVLVAEGAWMKYGRNRLSQEFKDGGILLLSCGCSAMFFGALYGSVFGYEGLFHALWVNPLNPKDITQLLLTAIGTGILFSSLAIIINIINHFTAKKYFDGIFDRFGLLGLLFFWFALGFGCYMACVKKCITWAVVLIAVPLALLFLKGLLKRFMCKNEEKESLINTGLESCIELMETLTGYISGTVSFVRVGAFAISHAALCMAIFSMVNMLKNVPGSGIWSLLIIILGNIGIIVFEGMVAMIQAVRLEYYELFGKYFSGNGIAYEPFVLNNHNKEQK